VAGVVVVEFGSLTDEDPADDEEEDNAEEQTSSSPRTDICLQKSLTHLK